MSFQLKRGDRPLSTLVATLDHLVLESPDIGATARFYATALGYRPETADAAVILRAADRTLVIVPGAARTLAAAGYRVLDRDELDRLRRRVLDAGFPVESVTSPVFDIAIGVTDPDGNRYFFGVAHTEAATSPTPAARLQHVVFASRNPHAIVDFFTDALGFTLSDEVVDDVGGVRTSFLRCSEEHHSFAVFKAPVNRLDHHCYETTDWNAIRDWCDHFASLGLKVQWGPGRHGPGNNLFAFVRDPDGNWVELSAELEAVTHARAAGRWPHSEKTLNSWGMGLLRS